MKTIIRATLLATFLIVGLIGSTITFTGETLGMASTATADNGGVTSNGFTWG